MERYWWVTYKIRQVVEGYLHERKSREAVDYLRKVLKHRRLARVFFLSSSADVLPLSLVLWRGKVTKTECRRLLTEIRPLLSGDGQKMVTKALSILDRPRWLELCQRLGLVRERPDLETAQRIEEAIGELFRRFGYTQNEEQFVLGRSQSEDIVPRP